MQKVNAEVNEHVKAVRTNLRPSSYEKLRVLAFHERTTIAFQIRKAIDSYLEGKRQPA